MSLELLQLIVFLIGVLTLASGVWLLVHARDVARVFRREPEVAVGPGPRKASRSSVIFALLLFNLGWISALVFWSLVI